MFESSVILEGSKTQRSFTPPSDGFESSVILEGSKTETYGTLSPTSFESSVILEGSKTNEGLIKQLTGLRVVLF